MKIAVVKTAGPVALRQIPRLDRDDVQEERVFHIGDGAGFHDIIQRLPVPEHRAAGVEGRLAGLQRQELVHFRCGAAEPVELGFAGGPHRRDRHRRLAPLQRLPHRGGLR